MDNTYPRSEDIVKLKLSKILKAKENDIIGESSISISHPKHGKVFLYEGYIVNIKELNVLATVVGIKKVRNKNIVHLNLHERLSKGIDSCTCVWVAGYKT